MRLMKRGLLALTLSLPFVTSVAASDQFMAVLNGGNVVDASGTARKGDLDGHGTFTALYDAQAGQLCYTLLTAGVGTPTAITIRTGAAGGNGAIFLTLNGAVSTSGLHAVGCVAITPTKLQYLRNEPGARYVDVRTSAFPAGALRGQLF